MATALSTALSMDQRVTIASSFFTLCTAAVMPLYTLMLFAPQWDVTERVMSSPIPSVLLAAIYIYLLYLSWTPHTLNQMFASKYWLPELASITQMFRSTLTVASAWIHLLCLDLFAAQQVYIEGLRLRLETRHSLVLCMLFAPLGLACHAITKAIVAALELAKRTSRKL